MSTTPHPDPRRPDGLRVAEPQTVGSAEPDAAGTPGTVPALELTGIGFGFGRGEDVLRGVDLQVHDAEIAALLGPSGCG